MNKCDLDTQNRVCSQCGYEVEDSTKLRCPRCNNILLKKCSECNKCSFA